MMSKVDVNGDKADPLFKWLCGAPGLLSTKGHQMEFTSF
jgi:glutathione peroxidase